MKYILVFRLNASINLTTKGCFEAHSIYTSRCVIFKYDGSLRSSGSLNRLIATSSFVYLFLHLITTPYVPSPIYSICSYFCMNGVLKLESEQDSTVYFPIYLIRGNYYNFILSKIIIMLICIMVKLVTSLSVSFERCLDFLRHNY